MELDIFRQFQHSTSMIGWCQVSTSKLITLERCWNDNVPGASCVPAGFYHLIPHNGTKYQETFALIGQTVGHAPGQKRRSTCVIHWEDDAAFLEGCISFAGFLGMKSTSEFCLSTNMVDFVLMVLRKKPGPHYLTIHDPTRGPHTCNI